MSSKSKITYTGQGNLGQDEIVKKESKPDPKEVVIQLKPDFNYKKEGIDYYAKKRRLHLLKGGILKRKHTPDSISVLVGGVGFGAGQIVQIGTGPYLIGINDNANIAAGQMNYLMLLLAILLLISAFIWALLRFCSSDFISPSRLSKRKNDKTQFSFKENIPLQNGLDKKSVTSDSALSTTPSTKNYSNLIFENSTLMPQSKSLLVECDQLKLIFTVSVTENSPGVWSSEDGKALENKLEKCQFRGCRSVHLAHHGRILVGLMNADHIVVNMSVPKFWYIFSGQLIASPNLYCQSACVYQNQYLIIMTPKTTVASAHANEITIFDITNFTTLQTIAVPSHAQLTLDCVMHNSSIFSRENDQQIWILLSIRHKTNQITSSLLYQLNLEIEGTKKKRVVNHTFNQVTYGPPGFMFVNAVTNPQNSPTSLKKSKKKTKHDDKEPIAEDTVLIAYPSGKTIEWNSRLKTQETISLVNQKIISIQSDPSNKNLLILQPNQISIFHTQPKYKLECDLPVKFDFEICTMAYSSNRNLISIYFDSGSVMIYRIDNDEYAVIGSYKLPNPIVKLQFLKTDNVLIGLSSKVSQYKLFFLPFNINL